MWRQYSKGSNIIMGAPMQRSRGLLNWVVEEEQLRVFICFATIVVEVGARF